MRLSVAEPIVIVVNLCSFRVAQNDITVLPPHARLAIEPSNFPHVADDAALMTDADRKTLCLNPVEQRRSIGRWSDFADPGFAVIHRIDVEGVNAGGFVPGIQQQDTSCSRGLLPNPSQTLSNRSATPRAMLATPTFVSQGALPAG